MEERMTELCRFNDMRTILPLMRAAPSLLEALDGAYRSLDYISDVIPYEDGEPVTALEIREIEAIFMESTANLVEIENIIMNVMRELKGPSPIELAKAATPFWFQTIHSYDGLELAPVAEYEGKESCKFCERVDDPKDAQLWSVFGHLPEGGVECLEDFPTEREAFNFANSLLEIYTNLHKHGLIYA
ncbi:MAG: hypothetical protein JAY82_18255 [Candidatus Thiodiazotropha taylori]|nr:hypothetical protein [Candidatus Thiodiazotropha taylori]